jgi:hypothetical protein
MSENNIPQCLRPGRPKGKYDKENVVRTTVQQVRDNPSWTKHQLIIWMTETFKLSKSQAYAIAANLARQYERLTREARQPE